MCDYAGGTRQNLSYHTKVVHEKIKDIKCEHCDKMFWFQEHLTVHVKVVHKKIKEYECKTCDHKFGTNWHLKNHIERVHDKDKPTNSKENIQERGDDVTETTCQMCGFKSSKISELASHYYVHFPVQDINREK